MKSFFFSIGFLIFPISIFSQTIVWELTSQTLVGNVNVVYVTTEGELFAGTLIQGVYFSSDGGRNWLQRNNGLTDQNVFAFLEYERDIFCGSLGGIFKTTDKGNSWVPMSNGLTDTYINTLAITKDRKFLAGTLYSGLFISTDYGNSWNQMQNDFSSKSVNCILAKSDGFIFVGTTSGLYRATQRFDFWSKVDADFKTNNNINTIALDSSGNLYAGTNNGMIYKSTNNGVNWTKVFEITGSPIYKIIVSPRNSIFATTWGNGILRSKDNGQNWEFVNDGLFNPYITSMVYLPTRELFASSWGNGVFYGKEYVISTYAEGEYCAGAEIRVRYEVDQTFANDNFFIAQLSDNSGKFTNPVEIGRVNSTTSGIISARIPQNSPSGISYRVRVFSTNPSIIGADNRKNLRIFRGLNPSISGPALACTGDVQTYSSQVKIGVISFWSVSNGEILMVDDTNMIVKVKWLNEGIGRLKLVQKLVSGGCDDSTEIVVQIYPTPPKPLITRKGYVLYSSSKTGNQWFLFDTPIQGATADSLEVDTPGLYYVQVTNEYGCVSEMSDPFDFYYNVVGNTQIDAFKIFPLPANERLFVSSTVQIYRVQILDILGNKTLEENFINPIFVLDLDVNNIPIGSYYLSIFTKEGHIHKKFLIIR
ncbi:MAG: two-component regulator propeller domain-containing protein [Candidatus Kapaibacteriales bacterium]